MRIKPSLSDGKDHSAMADRRVATSSRLESEEIIASATGASHQRGLRKSHWQLNVVTGSINQAQAESKAP